MLQKCNNRIYDDNCATPKVRISVRAFISRNPFVNDYQTVLEETSLLK